MLLLVMQSVCVCWENHVAVVLRFLGLKVRLKYKLENLYIYICQRTLLPIVRGHFLSTAINSVDTAHARAATSK